MISAAVLRRRNETDYLVGIDAVYATQALSVGIKDRSRSVGPAPLLGLMTSDLCAQDEVFTSPGEAGSFPDAPTRVIEIYSDSNCD